MNAAGELILLILGGGTIAGVASVIGARALARKHRAETEQLDAETPVKVDSFVVQGAEQAVLSLQAALTASDAQNRQLRLDVAQRDEQIEQLRTEVASLRQKVDIADAATAEAKRDCAALEQRISDISDQHHNR